MKKLNPILIEQINIELIAQHEKWGDQNHPSVDVQLLSRSEYPTDRMCQEYEIPTEARAKSLCQIAEKTGQLTWAHIAVEELAEAIASSTPSERRKEIVQLITVLCNWVHSIDKNEL